MGVLIGAVGTVISRVTEDISSVSYVAAVLFPFNVYQLFVSVVFEFFITAIFMEYWD